MSTRAAELGLLARRDDAAVAATALPAIPLSSSLLLFSLFARLVRARARAGTPAALASYLLIGRRCPFRLSNRPTTGRYRISFSRPRQSVAVGFRFCASAPVEFGSSELSFYAIVIVRCFTRSFPKLGIQRDDLFVDVLRNRLQEN